MLNTLVDAVCDSCIIRLCSCYGLTSSLLQGGTRTRSPCYPLCKGEQTVVLYVQAADLCISLLEHLFLQALVFIDCCGRSEVLPYNVL